MKATEFIGPEWPMQLDSKDTSREQLPVRSRGAEGGRLSQYNRREEVGRGEEHGAEV